MSRKTPRPELPAGRASEKGKSTMSKHKSQSRKRRPPSPRGSLLQKLRRALSMEPLESRLYLSITTGSDSYTSAMSATLAIPDYAGVLANDSDSGGASLTAVLVSSPSYGS